MRNIFGEEVSKRRRQTSSDQPRKTSKKPDAELGCSSCLMNKVPGINKVINIDKITGRRLMIWAQSPGKNENLQKKELVGDVGIFLWNEFEPFGITRDDADLQNVLRCRPFDRKTLTEYQATSKEFKRIQKCCSVFNPQAITAQQKKAVVHLILGKVAGQQLLGKFYRKDKAVIWYEPWNAYVVIADHPSYLLRMGGRKAGWAYFAFRDRLKAVKTILDHPGRWGYVNRQDYGSVNTPEEMDQLKEYIEYRASLGERIACDVEDGEVNGKKVPLVIGFGWGKYSGKHGARSNPNASWDGGARSVVLYHPEANLEPKVVKYLLSACKEVIENPKIIKIFQHGSYDDGDVFQKMLGWRLRGYGFDTQYGTYLKYPHLRSYSLEKQCALFLPEFEDYKEMAKPYYGNFVSMPLEQMIVYNCADNDSTKRLECKTAGHISIPLLQVYIHCAYILEQMEPRGPFLDPKGLEKLRPVVHEQVESLRGQLELLTDGKKEDFNPNSHFHIAWLLYDHLGLPQPLEQISRGKFKRTRSTSKEALEKILIDTGSKVPQLVIDYRSVSKLEGTYCVGYEKSASLHNGRVTTIWHLTGAVTGRLRSGKGDKAEVELGIVNLQNVDGRPVLKNLLVSDLNWRIAL